MYIYDYIYIYIYNNSNDNNNVYMCVYIYIYIHTAAVRKFGLLAARDHARHARRQDTKTFVLVKGRLHDV